MKTIGKIILVLVTIAIIIEILKALVIPALVVGGVYVGYRIYKKMKLKRVETVKVKHKQSKLLEKQQTIEYKMTNLLKQAGFNPNDASKRTAYKIKEELNLLDLWYKYIDLRAKLHLNNTSTSREEAVLHLMCDEVLMRIELADVEVSSEIKKEFIIENVKPLLTDILDILEGVRPVDSISIDAYQLLNKSKGESEPILETLYSR